MTIAAGTDTTVRDLESQLEACRYHRPHGPYEEAVHVPNLAAAPGYADRSNPNTVALVELRAGTIALQSEPGSGSRFTFTLPSQPLAH